MSKYECKKAYISFHPEEGHSLIWYENSFFPPDCKEYTFAEWVEVTLSDELSLLDLELAPGLYQTSFDIYCSYDDYSGETDLTVLFDDFILVEAYSDGDF